MSKKIVAEVLYLTNILEKIIEREGGKGVSFSDKIKSFDKYKKSDDYSHIGYKFYYDSGLGEYHIKDRYLNDDDYDSDEEDIYDELYQYRRFKNDGYNYREYKRGLIADYYNDLRWIAHERNQIMHVHNYKIKNYPKFRAKAMDIIDFFKSGKKVKKERFYFYLQKRYLLAGIMIYLLFSFKGYIIKSIESFDSSEYISVLDKKVSWMKDRYDSVIHTNENRKGSYIDIANENCNYYTVISETVPMRMAPNIQAQSVGTLSNGMIICIATKENGWLQAKGGVWIEGRYLKEEVKR